MGAPALKAVIKNTNSCGWPLLNYEYDNVTYSNLKEAHLKMNEREEHEDEADAARKQQIRLGLVRVSHSRYSREERTILLLQKIIVSCTFIGKPFKND